MKKIFVIWAKEIRDSIRDRRTLVSTIILPMFLMPIIIVGMGQLAESQVRQVKEQPVTIGVANAAESSAFIQLIRQSDKTTVIELTGNLAQAVRDKKADTALALPDDFSEQIEAGQAVTAEVYNNALNTKSTTALTRLTQAVTLFNQAVVQARFAESGIEGSVLNGASLKTNEVATEQELGGFGLGFLLPLFIIMWSVVGGQNIAVDVSAGEKERKTLEALFMAPVRRLDVVFGKFLAVASMALLSVIVALTSLYAVFIFGGADLFTSMNSTTGSSGVVSSAESSFNFSLEPGAILTMFGISILLVCLFSALNLSVAIFAKSYKEAQSYIGPSYLVVILPVVLVNTLPGFTPALGFFAIPVVNAVLLFKEVLIGTFNTGHILMTVASLTVTALLAILIASRIYRREGVLFRE